VQVSKNFLAQFREFWGWPNFFNTKIKNPAPLCTLFHALHSRITFNVLLERHALRLRKKKPRNSTKIYSPYMQTYVVLVLNGIT
jgi:hypothetical protein